MGRSGRTRRRCCPGAVSAVLTPAKEVLTRWCGETGGPDRWNWPCRQQAERDRTISRGYTYFWTLPALRQRVQTYSRLGEPFTWIRTFCRFGLKRRLVATIEWLRLLPNAGPFLHAKQVFGTADRLAVAQVHDRVSHSDLTVLDDVRVDAPAVHETPQHGRVGELLEVAAGLAQLDADRLHRPDPEAPADQ